MKTHLILFKQTGENSDTPRSPACVYVPGTVDLTKTTTCILSSDDWRCVEVDLYEVREVALPDWLSPEEWLSNYTSWKYLWGSGVQQDWSEAVQRALLPLPFDWQYGLVSLLKVKKFRSEYRASLRRQVDEWCATPRDQRRYEYPLSPRQFGTLLRNPWEAKYASENLYHNRGSLCTDTKVVTERFF